MKQAAVYSCDGVFDNTSLKMTFTKYKKKPHNASQPLKTEPKPIVERPNIYDHVVSRDSGMSGTSDRAEKQFFICILSQKNFR